MLPSLRLHLDLLIPLTYSYNHIISKKDKDRQTLCVIVLLSMASLHFGLEIYRINIICQETYFRIYIQNIVSINSITIIKKQKEKITLDMKMKIFRLEIIYNDMEYACTNEYPKKQLRVYYSK